MADGHYEIRGAVADATFVSPDIKQNLFTHFASITFYSDDTYSSPVLYPLAGTVQFEASEDGYAWGKTGGGAANDGLIVAAGAYARPNLKGSIKKMRVTLSGVTNATHFIVRISSTTGV